MHRHFTALRRASLSSGVVIQESERGSPWADSIAVMRDCAGQILKELEPDESLLSKQSASLQSFRDYLSIHGERLAFDLDYMKELAEATERVLEIGALPFMLTLPLMRRGYNVTALDKPTSEWDPAVPMRLGLNHVACDLDIQPLPFKTNSFDVVLMNQVFAHLRVDLIGSMREIFRVLRPGGLLYLSSPNLRSFRALAQLIFRGDATAHQFGTPPQPLFPGQFEELSPDP
jgi:SAM-dependent methyltransferase